MKGWTDNRTMSQNFYRYDYDTNQTSSQNAPNNFPRAEGAMVWIPAGDSRLLVYFGGLVDLYLNNTQAQPFDTIFMYDPSGNTWYTQTVTGEIPGNRRQFCAGATWAPGRSIYNM
jgi:hypothetical protein